MTFFSQSLLQTLNPQRIHFPRYHLSCFHHLLRHPEEYNESNLYLSLTVLEGDWIVVAIPKFNCLRFV